jgi:hypothetical protein
LHPATRKVPWRIGGLAPVAAFQPQGLAEIHILANAPANQLDDASKIVGVILAVIRVSPNATVNLATLNLARLDGDATE